MLEENQESNTTTEEVEAKVEEATSETNAQPSKETEKASEGRSYTNEEVEKLVKKQAQSLKDKELKPVYEELNNYKAEMKRLKDEQVRRDTEAKLAAQEKQEAERWAEEGVPETAIKSWQEARREGTKKLAEIENLYNSRLPEIKQGKAFVLAMDALKDILPDGEKVVSTIQDFLKVVQEGESDREMSAIARVKAIETKYVHNKPEDKEVESKKRPDSSAHSLSNDKDLNKLSARELLKLGVKQKTRR